MSLDDDRGGERDKPREQWALQRLKYGMAEYYWARPDDEDECDE